MFNQDYHPDDIKGKGEPSYSIEKALKEHKIHGDKEDNADRGASGEATGIEMQNHPGGTVDSRDPVDIAGGRQRYTDSEHGTASTPKPHALNGLKKRIGSLRKKKD